MKDATFGFLLEEELLRAAHKKAREIDVPLAQIIRLFLRQWLDGDIVYEVRPTFHILKEGKRGNGTGNVYP